MIFSATKAVLGMDFQNFCRGVLYGGLLGDCYGYVYEDRSTVPANVPLKLLSDTIAQTSTSELIYTDDTQMGLGTLRSLRNCSGFRADDLAREFATNYFRDGAKRYYGGSIPKVFNQWEASRYKDVFTYPAAQFNGTGSFGNGGAMRVSPTSLYALEQSEKDFEDLIVETTRLTHSHPLAILGALLQAFAVRRLWQLVSKYPDVDLHPDKFLDSLLERLRQVKNKFVNFQENKWSEALSAYEERFSRAKDLLHEEDPSVDQVVKMLGNDLRAINSVPTALFVFLRSLKPIDGIDLKSIPLRCLVYAITLGGDTDTIGTMACSLAGGFVGLSSGPQIHPTSPLPDVIMNRCEGLDTVKEMVNWLVNRRHTG